MSAHSAFSFLYSLSGTCRVDRGDSISSGGLLPTRHVRVRKEKGSLERVGSYCRYKQSEGKQTSTEEGMSVCVCVCVSAIGAWNTRRRYNLKLCAQKHVTISRLRGTCSVYVRLSPSLSFLLVEKKTVKDRGNDASLSTIFLSRVFGFVGFVRFLPDDTYYPSLPFCGLPRVCDT